MEQPLLWSCYLWVQSELVGHLGQGALAHGHGPQPLQHQVLVHVALFGQASRKRWDTKQGVSGLRDFTSSSVCMT